MRKILLTVLLLCILSSICTAESFSINHIQSSISSCEANPNYVDIISISNNGLFSHKYHVDFKGDMANYAYTIPNNVFLKHGDTQELYVYLTTPINKNGKSELTASVKSDENVEKQIKYNIETIKCDNLQFIAKYSQITTCPGRTLTIPLSIKNTGVFKEQYDLNVPDFGTVTYSEKTVILDAGEKRDLFLYLDLPDDYYGNYEYKIDINTVKSQLSAELPILLNVNSCFDFAINLDDNYESCKKVDTNLSFTISNKAEVENEFYIELEGPNYMKLLQNKVTIPALSTQEVLFDSKPLQNSIRENINIKAKSKLGELISNASFEFTPGYCYDVSLNVLPELNTCACEADKYPIKIKNVGTIPDVYYIEVFTDKKANLINWNKSFSLKHNEEIEFALDIDTDCNAKGSYDIITRVTSKNNGLIYENKSKVIITSANKCRLPKITLDESKYDFFNITKGNLNIKNVGVKSANYELSSLPSNVAKLDAKSVSLEPGNSFNVGVNWLINASGGYDVLFNATVKEQSHIEKYTVTFVRPIDWILVAKMLGVAILTLLLILLLVYFLANYKGREQIQKKVDKTTQPIIEKPKKEKFIEIQRVKNDTLKEFKEKETKEYRFKWKPILILLLIILLLFSLSYGYQNYAPLLKNSTSSFFEKFDYLGNDTVVLEDNSTGFNFSKITDKFYSFFGKNEDNVTIIEQPVADIIALNQTQEKTSSFVSYFEPVKDWFKKAFIYVKVFFIGYWVYIVVGFIVLFMLILLLDQKDKNKDFIPIKNAEQIVKKKEYEKQIKGNQTEKKKQLISALKNLFFEEDKMEEEILEKKEDVVVEPVKEKTVEIVKDQSETKEKPNEPKKNRKGFLGRIVEFFFDVEEDDLASENFDEKKTKEKVEDVVVEDKQQDKHESEESHKTKKVETKPNKKVKKVVKKKENKIKKSVQKVAIKPKPKTKPKPKPKPKPKKTKLMPPAWSKVTKYKKVK